MSNADDIKGRAKEATGALTGNEDLERDGETDQLVGKAKGIVKDVKDKVDHAIDSVKDKLHRD